MSTELIRILNREAEASNKPFLLIGGVALNTYGSSRITGDLDYAITNTDFDWWGELLKKYHYSLVDKQAVAARFRYKDPGFPLVDLILLDSGTLDKLRNNCKINDLNGIACPVPAPLHLVAMKLHAIKQNGDRFGKDMSDILWLIESQHIDIEDVQLNSFLLKHGSAETVNYIKNAIRRK